jgi:hypothetical protein
MKDKRGRMKVSACRALMRIQVQKGRMMQRPCDVLRASGRALLATVFLMLSIRSGANEALSEGWRHPDSRFRAIDEALDRDDFPEAQKQLSQLKADAKRGKDQALQQEISERAKEITRLEREFEKISKAWKTLASGVSDKHAATLVGKYTCAIKGDWDRALTLFASCDEPNLVSAAKADQKNAGDAVGKMAIANLWWLASEGSTEADDRLAFQLRARQWMIQAYPGAPHTDQVTIAQRLRQLPLLPEKIVIWNTHNGPYRERGASELMVSLLHQGKVVWKKSTAIPWRANDPAFVVLRPARVRADQIRVDITRNYLGGAGLGEIEVFAGATNIARGCQPQVSSFFQSKNELGPGNLVDGDTSGNTGYWIANDGTGAWASVRLSGDVSER